MICNIINNKNMYILNIYIKKLFYTQSENPKQLSNSLLIFYKNEEIFTISC